MLSQQNRLEPPERHVKFMDLARFAKLQLASKDIDPLYPVLRYLQRDMDPEQALWHSLLYVAYYNIGSSSMAFQRFPNPTIISDPAFSRLPTGTERRNLRGGKIGLHTMALRNIDSTTGLFKWFEPSRWSKSPYINWLRCQTQLREIWGNGRWAAYKTGEVLMKVNGWPLQPTDMGNEFSSGPRWGLELFFGKIAGNGKLVSAVLDQQGENLRQSLAYVFGLDIAVEELETVLCDFHSLHVGRYYVGHDIDQMMDQLGAFQQGHYPMDPSDRTSLAIGPVWDARRATLPNRYLGELNGWWGIDKARRTVYRDQGKVIDRE